MNITHIASATLLEYRLLPEMQKETIFEWEQDMLDPFNELIVSFNALRPERGSYLLRIRVKLHGIQPRWSSWFNYAEWGKSSQKTFNESLDAEKLDAEKLDESIVQSYQDTIIIASPHKACGFQIQVEALDGARLNQFYALFAHIHDTDIKMSTTQMEKIPPHSVQLPVEGLSQLALASPFASPLAKRLCSPTSTTSVVRYLTNQTIDVLDFAEHVYDYGHDIYGNWIFNVAQAFCELGPSWKAFVSRLNGFEPIYKNLMQSVPSIVSVRGILPGAYLPYTSGHLLAVIGYDAVSDSILCMDPAFLTNAETQVKYPRKAFLEAWNNRGLVAYMFERIDPVGLDQ